MRRTESTAGYMLTNKKIQKLIDTGQKDRIPPDILALYEENMEARKHYCDEGIRSLEIGICLQAVNDWRRPKTAVQANGWTLYDKEEIAENGGWVRKECEEFFDSDLFTSVTGMSGKEETVRRLSKLPSITMEALYRYNRRKNA